MGWDGAGSLTDMYRGGKKDTLPRAIFSKSGSFTLMSRRHSVCMPFWQYKHRQTDKRADMKLRVERRRNHELIEQLLRRWCLRRFGAKQNDCRERLQSGVRYSYGSCVEGRNSRQEASCSTSMLPLLMCTRCTAERQSTKQYFVCTHRQPMIRVLPPC